MTNQDVGFVITQINCLPRDGVIADGKARELYDTRNILLSIAMLYGTDLFFLVNLTSTILF